MIKKYSALLASVARPIGITFLVILTAVNSVVFYTSDRHTAMAGEQGWDTISNPGGTNAGAVASPVIANDGTIFVTLTGSNSITWSTDGGISFRAAGVSPGGGSAVVDIALSPTFGSDRVIFALTADRNVYGSTDAGLTFVQVGAVAATNGTNSPTAMAISPNFANGIGQLLVSSRASAVNQLVRRANINLSTTAMNGAGHNFADFGGLTDPSLGNDAANTEGAYDIEYSPNFASDGIIIAIVSAAGTGAPAQTGAANTVAEVRSLNGAAFATPVGVAGTGAPAPNNTAVSLGATGTARLNLPAGYSPSGSDNYFLVLNNAANDARSGFYRRAAGGWTQTINTLDLVSVASSGVFGSASVLVGERASAQLRRSGNGGSSWAAAPIVFSGAGPAYATFSSGFSTNSTVYAANGGNGGGFWRSTTSGTTTSAYTGLGLHSAAFNAITGLALAPNFDTTFNMFVVGNNGAGAGHSVFKVSGLNLFNALRVSSMAGVVSVALSPNYLTDNIVWIADTTGNLQKSTDGGNSFSAAFLTQNPVPSTRSGNGLIPASTNTLYIIGGQTAANLNQVVKTVDGGLSYSITTITGLQNITSLRLSPNFASDNTILVGGLTPSGLSQVYKSTDGGSTFAQLGGNLVTTAATGTQVVFSDRFSTDKAIYASAQHTTAGGVYRWIDGTSTAWLDLKMGAISTTAAAVYVPNLSSFANVGNIAVANGVLYASRGGATVHPISRALTPTASPSATSFFIGSWLDLQWVPRGGVNIFAAGGSGSLRQAVQSSPLFTGVVGADIDAGTIGSQGVGFGADGAVGGGDDGVDLNTGVAQVGLTVAVRSGIANHIIAIDVGPASDTLINYTDNMISAPSLSTPSDNATIPLPGQAVGHPQIIWQAYTPQITTANTTGYLVRFSSSADFSDQTNTTYGVLSGTSTTPAAAGALGGAPAFSAGTMYYYQLSVVTGAAAPGYTTAGAAVAGQIMDVGSPWTPVRRYGSAAGTPNPLTPVSAPGRTVVVPSKLVTFNWSAVALATDYKIEISEDGILDPQSTVGAYKTPVLSQVVAGASPSYTLTDAQAALLKNDTQYFWHVQAFFGQIASNYTNLSAQGGASSFFRTPVVNASTATASVTLAGLINTANPSSSILNIAWAQNITTGEYTFLAPGVSTSSLNNIEANSALFINLSTATRLRISGRDPITVPAGGRWITVGSPVTIEVVP